MNSSSFQSYIPIALVALVSSAVGALLVIFLSGGSADWTKAEEDASPPKPLEMIDAFSCKEGLTPVKLLRGVPDNFDRTELEPAVMREELRAVPRFVDANGQLDDFFTRQYDEGGTDKQLIDYFEVPKGIVSGALLIGMKPAGGNDNDNIALTNLKSEVERSILDDRDGYAFLSATEWEKHKLKGTPNLYKIDITDFRNALPDGEGKGLLPFFNSKDRDERIDLRVSDDTIIDFAALLLCQEPKEARATTYREYSSKPWGKDVSFLSCDFNSMQPRCDPYTGTQSCSQPLPMACFQPNNKPGPIDRLAGGAAGYDRFVIQGEVRLTPAVRAGQFAQLAQADQFCASEFGKGWRVLEFNESGGGSAISYSDIPINTAAIVNVSNQPYANCWDRPESVIEQ